MYSGRGLENSISELTETDEANAALTEYVNIVSI